MAAGALSEAEFLEAVDILADVQRPERARAFWERFDTVSPAFALGLSGAAAREALDAIGARLGLAVYLPPGPGYGAMIREPARRERGEAAILIPLSGGYEAAPHRLLPLSPHAPRVWRDAQEGLIADLLAVFEGGRWASLSGTVTAIGAFMPAGNVLKLSGQVSRFLKRHAARVDALCTEYPPHVAALLTPLPDEIETLILDPRAFEWRLREAGCVIPEGVSRIECLDSRELAAAITPEVTRKEQARAVPQIVAPSAPARPPSAPSGQLPPQGGKQDFKRRRAA